MDYRGQAALPRGIRNNNPGNIETGEPWNGRVAVDGPFIVFADTTWGIRALAMDLATKINKDGLDTISKIIAAYAPASDNNEVGPYIADVSNISGIGADDQLGSDADTLFSLIRGIVSHENGATAAAQYVSDDDVNKGISMMGNSPLTVFQAGAVAVEANPVQAVVLLVVGAFVLNALLKGSKK